MIFKAAINMGNDQPLNMATGNISTRRLAIRKLSEKKNHRKLIQDIHTSISN